MKPEQSECDLLAIAMDEVPVSTIIKAIQLLPQAKLSQDDVIRFESKLLKYLTTTTPLNSVKLVKEAVFNLDIRSRWTPVGKAQEAGGANRSEAAKLL
jgi:hypothetical protein